MSIVRLAELIAEKQSCIPTEPPESLRNLGYTRFLEGLEREIESRAVAVALFGIDRCAGCRFFSFDGSHLRGHCVRLGLPRGNTPYAEAAGWCGQHEPILLVGA